MGVTPGTYKILGINRELTTICGIRLRQARHSVQLLANRAIVAEANRRNKRSFGAPTRFRRALTAPRCICEGARSRPDQELAQEFAMMRRLLLALCLVAAIPGMVPAQTLRIALREDADLLDPTLARTYVGRIVFAGLCDKLFDLNEKLEIVPQLATGYEWADPVTLIIHLRAGVTFHDGESLDAASVKYTLERDLTLAGSFRRSEIASIDHVEIVDPATVKIVLKSPSSPLLSQLPDRAGMILPPKATQAGGKDFSQAPVCSGPFSFTERVAQDRGVLDRYPGYWDAKGLHFDRVIYQPMPDSAVQLANLRSGTIDLAERVLPTDIAQVKADPKLLIVTSPALGYEAITFNVGNGERAKAPIGQNKL